LLICYIVIGLATGVVASLISALSGGSFLLLWCTYVSAGLVSIAVLSGAYSVLIDFFHVIKASTYGYDRQKTKDCRETATFTKVESLPPSTRQGAELRILAVDDDPLILDLIKVIAQSAGIYNFVTAPSGEAALAMLADPRITFHYFLFDIKMVGMDGIELCQRVREIPRYRVTPITMLTGVRDVAHMSQAFRAGANDYVTKPFDVAELEVNLHLALKSYKLRVDANSSTKGRGINGSTQISGIKFKRIGGIWHDRRNPLVDEIVLSTYLTRLPQKALEDIRVFAVSIGRLDTVPARELHQWRAELRGDLAEAAAESFGGNLTVMAHTEDYDLLVVTHSVSPLDPIEIERDIELRLRRRWSATDYGLADKVVTSVGGPVQLRSANFERNTFAIDRAIMLSEDRIVNKLGASLRALRNV